MWQPGSCPEEGEGWCRQSCCQVAETSLSHDSKWRCSQLMAGKCSEKGASDCKSCLDIGVFSPKPAKSMLHVNYGHDKAQVHHPISQSDGNQKCSHVPGLNQRGFSGVTCQCSTSQRKKEKLHVLRHGCSPLQMGRHRMCPLDHPGAGQASCWPDCSAPALPGSGALGPQACGSACPSQVRNTDCLLQPGFQVRRTLHEAVVERRLGFERNGAHWWQPAWAQESSMYPHATTYFNFWWAAFLTATLRGVFILLFCFSWMNFK